MQRVVFLSSLPLLFWASAQDAPVNSPEAITPPAAVEIPELNTPTAPAAVDPHQVTSELPTGVNLSLEGNITPLDASNRRFRISGPIELKTNRGEELFADEAILDLDRQTYELQGNVSIFNGPMIQRGDRVTYNLKTQKLETSRLSVSYDPIILEAGSFDAAFDEDGQRIFVGENAGITTNDVESPHYWLRANRTTLYPGEKVVFDDLKLYIGDTPIFWLPYLSQPMNAQLGYRFLPGGRTNLGFYLLQNYGIMLGDDDSAFLGGKKPWLLSRWHLDARSRRGLGTGVDLFDTRLSDNTNLGWLKWYYTDDLDPSITRSGIPRGPIDSDRFRVEFQYRIPLGWQDPWNRDAEYAWNYDLHLLSDNNYLEDFDPRFYRNNAQPDNTIFFTRRDETSLFTGLARLRLNDFYRADSRSPELSFDQIRRPIFAGAIQHEGQTSFTIAQEHMADPTRETLLDPLLTLPANDPTYQSMLPQVGRYEQFLIGQLRALPPGDPQYDKLYRQLTNPEYSRFHTYQDFSTQWTLDDWLHLTPHAGAGYNRYFDVSGVAGDTDRGMMSTGLEASFKLQKDYPDFHIPSLGVNGVRHTLQPYAHWSYLSVNALDPNTPQIDRLTFFTRPVPIRVGRFTAIDDLNNWNLVRLGFRNRLLTQRDGGTYQWLYTDTYLDSYIDDPELNRQFSNLYQDITWQPLPWMAVDWQIQFPIFASGSGYNEFTTGLRFMPTPNFEFSIQQRTLDNHPFLLDSNRFNFRAYWRLNENWGLGLLQQWELVDDTLEMEQYTMHRNYENWIVSAGLMRRDNRVRSEYGFMINFTLKDFPDVSMPFSIDAE
jgi:LPS-assembly protein